MLRTGEQPEPLDECPDCHAPALTDDAEFADGKPTLFCTTCAGRFSPAELGNCARRAAATAPPATLSPRGRPLCAPCAEDIRRQEDERHWM